jgi:hypothetical protein
MQHPNAKVFAQASDGGLSFMATRDRSEHFSSTMMAIFTIVVVAAASVLLVNLLP